MAKTPWCLYWAQMCLQLINTLVNFLQQPCPISLNDQITASNNSSATHTLKVKPKHDVLICLERLG